MTTEKQSQPAKPKTTRRAPRKPSVPSPLSASEAINKKLKNIIDEIKITQEGKVDIDGKKYTTVAKRNELLRREFGVDVKVKTRVKHLAESVVIMETKIYFKLDGKWELIANGFAEEMRQSSEINKYSALENAETSSIGRALANLGLSGGEFASVNEVENNKKQQQQSSFSKIPKLISKVQRNQINKLSADNKVVIGEILDKYNITSLDGLTYTQAGEALKALSKKDETGDDINSHLY